MNATKQAAQTKVLDTTVQQGHFSLCQETDSLRNWLAPTTNTQTTSGKRIFTLSARCCNRLEADFCVIFWARF
jgi:hypothetical protein